MRFTSKLAMCGIAFAAATVLGVYQVVERSGLVPALESPTLLSIYDFGPTYFRDSAQVDHRLFCAVDSVGAIVLDSDNGLEQCRACIHRLFESKVGELSPAEELKDPKTRLQELLQSRRYPLPAYTVLEVSGKAHNQVFKVECSIENLDCVTTAQGKSRRKAEQAAAQLAVVAKPLDRADQRADVPRGDEQRVLGVRDTGAARYQEAQQAPPVTAHEVGERIRGPGLRGIDQLQFAGHDARRLLTCRSF